MQVRLSDFFAISGRSGHGNNLQIDKRVKREQGAEDMRLERLLTFMLIRNHTEALSLALKSMFLLYFIQSM